MSSRTRPPPALEPFLRLPPETALILLTGTLGCSVNWLAARFVGSLLSRTVSRGASSGANGIGVSDTAPGGEEDVQVLVVSFLRDESWWKAEIKRTTALDPTKLIQSKRLTILDILSLSTSSNTSTSIQSPTFLSTLSNLITSALNTTKPTILLLDSPDTLLALNPAIKPSTLHSTLLSLRSRVHATILSCSADWPLISSSSSTAADNSTTPPTPLETNHAAFVVQQAHAAQWVMSVRELDTGSARDVSGVLSVTRGGGWYALQEESEKAESGGGDGAETKEMEALYLVQRDGGVRVFGRGEGVG